MQRLVRRGVRAEDAEWIPLWNQFCKQCRIQPDIFQGTPKGPLTEFVERHMPMLRKKEWAKDLLFKPEGQTDDLPVDSEDDQDEENAAAPRGAAANKERPVAAGGPKAKTAADQAAGNRARPTRPREPARPAGPDDSCSSDSESSQSVQERQQRSKRRKKDDRKTMGGMLGYGGITPELMMMNQYMNMGSMMMMNNPLYASMGAAGMGAGMMPGMMGMMPGMKMQKKDDKTKKLKVDTKLPRERERGRERPVRAAKEPEDPRLNKPGAKPAPKPPPAPPPASVAKDAMIDAADL